MIKFPAESPDHILLSVSSLYNSSLRWHFTTPVYRKRFAINLKAEAGCFLRNLESFQYTDMYQVLKYLNARIS